MSDAIYTRSLTFKSDNLGKFATLVLVFDQPLPAEIRFPVVWRSSEFQSDGVSQVSVTYCNQPGFIKPGPLFNDIIVDFAASQVLDPSEKTNLFQDNTGRFRFTNPAIGSPDLATAINDTTNPNGEDIAFGFGQVDPNLPITPMYYWNPGDFPPQGSIETRLSSVLRGYITDQYDDAKILRTPIPVTAIFDQDLSNLAKDTVWILTFDSTTGQYKITPELD